MYIQYNTYIYHAFTVLVHTMYSLYSILLCTIHIPYLCIYSIDFTYMFSIVYSYIPCSPIQEAPVSWSCGPSLKAKFRPMARPSSSNSNLKRRAASRSVEGSAHRTEYWRTKCIQMLLGWKPSLVDLVGWRPSLGGRPSLGHRY